MGMPWARIDVDILRSRKYTSLRKSGNWRGVVAGIAGNLYAVEHQTDGFLDYEVVSELYARPGEEKALMAADLWIPVAGGYEIAGFAERQTVGNTSGKGRLAAAIRWSCANGHHDKCRLDGCPCVDCHQGSLA